MSNLLEKNSSILNQTGNILSSRYKTLTTAQVLQPFTSNGFELIEARVRKSKKIEKKDHAYHVVRLRSNDFKIGDDFIDIVISNSYDGSSPFKINLGIFRLVCSNGLVIGKSFFERTIKHVGNDFFTRVYLAVNEAIAKKDELVKLVDKLKITELSNEKILKFTSEQFEKRLENVSNLKTFETTARPLRQEDNGNTAWAVLNRVQEYLIRGGIKYTHESIDNGVTLIKQSTTREIKSPSEQLKINRLVFDGVLKIIDLVA